MLIAFDLDDTLLDHREAQRAAALELAALAVPEVPKRDPDPGIQEAFVARWRALSEAHLARYLRREVSFQGQRRARVREVLGADLDDRAADAVFSRYLARYEAEWRAFPDVMPVLEHLATRHPLLVISNGEPEQQRRKLRALGLESCIFGLITPEDAGAAKPSPAIFTVASARAGVPGQQCVYVGDDRELDARAAAAAGWTGIWLTREGADVDAGAEAQAPVLRIRSLVELPDVLATLKL